MEPNQELALPFMQATGVIRRETANFYLAKNKWDLARAIKDFTNVDHLTTPVESESQHFSGNDCSTSEGLSSQRVGSTIARSRLLPSSTASTAQSSSSLGFSRDEPIASRFVESVTSAKQSLEDLRQSFQKIEDASSKKGKILKDLQEEIEKKNGEFDIFKKLYDELKTECAVKDKNVNDFQEVIRELQKDIALKNSTINDAQKEIQNLKMDIGKKNEDFDILKQSFIELEKECVTKNKNVNDLQKVIRELQTDILLKDSTITYAQEGIKKLEQEISKKDVMINENQEEMKKLGQEIETKDAIINKSQEILPKTLIENSSLQRVIEWIPESVKPFVAPKGAITGDELGALMGSLVTTTAYNVSYSNKDLPGFLIVNSLANLVGSMIGQGCNNIVTHISQTNMNENKEWKKIVQVGCKSLIWTFLGALFPLIAGGFLPTYKARALVTSGVAFIVQCVLAIAWKMIHNIPKKQIGAIMLFGIVGIALAAAIPHILQIAKR